MTWRSSIIIPLLGLLALVASAQGPTADHIKKGRSYWRLYAHPINTAFSIEARAGLTAYTGELSSLKDGKLQNGYGNFSWGAGLDYRLTHFIKLAVKFKRFRLASESDPEFWNNRSFTSKNMQYTFSIEHNFFPHGALEDLDQRVNFYVSIGVGLLKYRTTVSDPPQGDDMTFKESTLVVPLGAGVSVHINRTTHLALEGHFYSTSSDNLDGTFLGSGEGGQNDGYFMLEVKYCWQIADAFNYNRHLRRIGR
ncbi:MAG: DUF6089 family protein [Cyclobacteriaceae bacterium]|nr:DUF6089 family protein [Cyclobacteriaceae bacterium]